ncbi:unnamed protein product [Anisakis simplex]|uniref:PEPCK_GTP domain-containing protein n=1 Tax=Anisakis simplex TaxID=6269 RepID=A0A0M3KJA6_ANISI|nr:unnamed protein product [Anisakis simplex]
MNLFLKRSDNTYEWPGYGDNIRIFDWIIRRLTADEKNTAVITPIGLIPQEAAMQLELNTARRIYEHAMGASNIPKGIDEEFCEAMKRLSKVA